MRVRARSIDVDFSQKSDRANQSKNPLQSFAAAASVMFAVVLDWMVSQAPVRDAVLVALPGSGDVQVEEQLALNDGELSDREKIDTSEFDRGPLVRVSAGEQLPGAVQQNYLSGSRIENYLRLHAANASLNSNHGMMPFARTEMVNQEF